MSAPAPNLSEQRRRARTHLASAGVHVLREDNHLLVVAKPAGLASQGGTDIDDHLVARVDAYRREAEQKPGRAYVGLVHRLDRNVSGVLVLAKTSKAAGRLAALFRERADGLRKIYLAWVGGRVAGDAGELTHRLRRDARRTHEALQDDAEGREARLSWRVDGRGRDATRLIVELHTGIAHQIRAQLALASHPLVGDAKYGGVAGARPALHAARLVFPHPVGGDIVDVAAAVPDDLQRIDRRLSITPPVASDQGA